MEQMVAQPELPLAEIELLSEAERHQLVTEFNDTAVDFGQVVCLHEVFERKVQQHPERIALVLGDASLTYGELNQRANRLARQLRTAGVGPDQVVGLLAVRSFEMIVSIMAILKAGGAYLPIDPELPTERIRFLLEDSRTQVLLAMRDALQGQEFDIQTFVLDDLALDSGPADNLDVVGTPSDLAYLIYTSGTTGKPKGVMVEHRQAFNLLMVMETAYPLLSNGSFLFKTNYAFDVSVAEVFGWFFGEGRLVILPPKLEKEPMAILREIERQQVTHVNFTASMLNVLLPSLEQPGITGLDNVSYVMVAGEVLPPKTVEVFYRLTRNVRLENLYGPTETTVYATMQSLDRETVHTKILIGRPMPNVQAYIVDTDNRLQPIGCVGEICLGGANVTRGYWGRRELSAEKYIDNPFDAGTKIYRSGDLGRWLPDGRIEFLGRIDHQVKVRGYRIELGEVEAHLLRHPLVSEALALGETTADGETYLCAYVVADESLSIQELKGDLARELPSYMVPTFIVRLDSMPHTPNGKTDRKALPKPDGFGLVTEEYVAPQRETEIKLAALWQDVLGVERVGLHDNFFDLGGHSLKAVQLISKLAKHMEVELALTDLFNYPTLQELAQQIDGGQNLDFHAIQPVEPRAYYPVSSAQKRLLILDHLETASTRYNSTVFYSLEGQVDPSRLETAFVRLMERHEILRTSFAMIDGELFQQVHPTVAFSMEQLEARDELEAQEMMDAFVRPFDLRTPQLFRVGLVKVAADKHYLMFDIHHIIMDGVSIQIMLEEFAKLYQGIELPKPRLQYKDFAVWQQEWQTSEHMKQQEAYWLDRLAGELPVLNLATDFARPAVQSYEGAVYRFVIDGELTAKLKTYLMQEQGYTLYMALLAVYHVFLSKYTGQKEIVIGSPIAGRTHADLEGILGIFINTLAMRSELDSGQTFQSFLADVKQHALDAFQNQDYPFEELVNKLNVDRDLSRNPLYSTLFAMQNMGAGQLALADVTVRALESEQENVKFDLALTAWEAGDEIACEFSYSTALFARETIARMAGHFLRIIEQVLENRSIPLGRIELLTAEEKAQVLNEFSLNPHDGGLRASQFCIHQLFEQEADKHPDHAAVVFKDQTLTYGELNAKANRLARYLRDKGVVPEQMVGLMVNRSAEMIIAILAVLKAGGAYLPIDPDYPSERILYMLEDCEVKFLLTQQALVDAVPAACTGEVIAIDTTDVYHGDGSNLPCVNKVTDLAYIIYTSGSTGKPKGVMIEHKGLCNMQSVFREQLHLNEQDRILQFATLSFDSSVLDIFMCFFSGATLVIPTKDIIASYAAFEQFMTEQEVTALCLQPSYAVNLNPDHLPKLKKMITGGAASSVEIYNKWASRVPYYNAYGPTENTILATIWHDSRYDKERTAIPIGRPLFNNG
ncbi:MAG: amino acid adenylation domain-containing protein, partial [Tumebacillaceae bacterium]